MREEIQAKNQEVDRETRRKAKLEKDLKAVQADCEAKVQDIKAKQNQLQKAEEEYKRCEQQLRETRVRLIKQHRLNFSNSVIYSLVPRLSRHCKCIIICQVTSKWPHAHFNHVFIIIIAACWLGG